MTDPTREDYERAAKQMANFADLHGYPMDSNVRQWASLLTAAAERMTWRPIAEAPKHKRVWVGHADGRMGCGIQIGDHAWWNDGALLDVPDGWLPLPPAPKTEGAE